MSKNPWLRGVVEWVWQNLLLFVGATVGAAVVKFATPDLTLPVAAVLGLTAMAAGAHFWNQYRQAADRVRRIRQMKRRRERVTAEAIESCIRGWLFRAGYTIEGVQDADCDFRMMVKDKQQRVVHVYREKGKVWLTIAGAVGINEEHRETARRPPFLQDVQIHLVQIGLEYNTDLNAEGAGVISFARTIPFGGETTELEFLRALLDVRRGTALIVALTQRHHIRVLGGQATVDALKTGFQTLVAPPVTQPAPAPPEPGPSDSPQ